MSPLPPTLRVRVEEPGSPVIEAISSTPGALLVSVGLAVAVKAPSDRPKPFAPVTVRFPLVVSRLPSVWRPLLAEPPAARSTWRVAPLLVLTVSGWAKLVLASARNSMVPAPVFIVIGPASPRPLRLCTRKHAAGDRGGGGPTGDAAVEPGGEDQGAGVGFQKRAGAGRRGVDGEFVARRDADAGGSAAEGEQARGGEGSIDAQQAVGAGEGHAVGWISESAVGGDC